MNSAKPMAQHSSANLPVEPTVDLGWIVVEEGFALAREHEVESLFAIGNGYVGSRASLAEGTPLSAPATFVAGVFASDIGSVPALARLADWTRLSITVDGQPLRLDQGRWLEASAVPRLAAGHALEGLATSGCGWARHPVARAAPRFLGGPPSLAPVSDARVRGLHR